MEASEKKRVKMMSKSLYKVVDRIVRAGLLIEAVGWDPHDLQPTGLEAFVQLVQLGVRVVGVSAPAGDVRNQQHLAVEVGDLQSRPAVVRIERSATTKKRKKESKR